MKKLIPEAKLPRRATSGSVGFDVQSSQVTVIPAMSQAIVHTGLAMAVPTGMYLRIAPRSSLSMKGINVGAGVVDTDFRGEIKVVLQNTTSKPFTVPFHSSVAQFIFEKNAIPCLTVCNNLFQTSRGPGGFGSSNTKPKIYTSSIDSKQKQQHSEPPLNATAFNLSTSLTEVME